VAAPAAEHGRPAGPSLDLARRRALARRRRKARIRRNRLVASLGCAGLGAAVFAVVGGGASSGGRAAAPFASLTAEVPAFVRVPGRPARLPWPARGEGAVAVLGTGLVAASPRSSPVPIASMTKMMTAYVVLADHPLAPGEQGPRLRMTGADVAAYVRASQSGESNVPVRAGEVLSEYQLLEALLVPSADNVADLLARWDAGSLGAFVRRMNATAHALGLRHTRYADASGVDPRSQSTAADQALLAARLMESPVVRSIVSRPSARFPVAGTIWNYNPALGTDGIVGVKSGYTSAAQACLAVAAWRRVGTRTALVVAVTTGQPDGLAGAARVDRQLLDATVPRLRLFDPLRTTSVVGSVSLPGSSAAAPLRPTRPIVLVAWPGLVLRERLVPASGTSAERSGPLGYLEVLAGGSVVGRAPLRAVAPAGGSLPGSSTPG